MTATPEQPVWSTSSVSQTRAFGEAIGRSLPGRLTIALVGPLGAGKTQLVKGIAAGNAVDDVSKVTSPTFTLVHEHPGRLHLYHLDAYRLRGPDELLALGIEEMIRADSVVIVEWADRAASILRDDALWIELTPTGETSRAFAFSASGSVAEKFLATLPGPRR